MGLNDTPSANRTHIGFFGRRNAGKSSIVNAVTGQDLSVVSDTKGTTTDPVYKSMELLPLGPVVIIDTPGFDDEGELGELRVKKTRQVLNKSDIAILVVDATCGLCDTDRQLISLFNAKELPYIIAYNKADLLDTVASTDHNTNQNTDDQLTKSAVASVPDASSQTAEAVDSNRTAADTHNTITVSAAKGLHIHELKELIGHLVQDESQNKRLVGDLLKPNDFVILVTPIDESAPKGRMILPQQQAIRDILDADATAIVVKEFQYQETLKNIGKKPAMVITDSQVFDKISKETPEYITLTSFSILMARYKGLLADAVKGVSAVRNLQDGDTVLIAEGCTHHRQCNDIGTVKLPRWLKKFTGKDLNIVTASGTEFPEDLSPYSLIIHCGGCMLNEREVRYRTKCASDQNVSITNYGVLIAYINGIFDRGLSLFPAIKALLK